MHLFAAAAFFSLLSGVGSRPMTPTLLLRADASQAGVSIAERSQYDIIRSCILTIIACVWTSGHPNIAGPKDAGWKTLKRRVITTIYALIAPEAVVMWALRQNIAAGRIANKYNNSTSDEDPWAYLMYKDIKRSTKEWFTDLSDDQVARREGRPWTKTHGLFVQMGGFMLYSNGQPVRVLSFKDFKALLDAGKIDEPLVTERELKDRTKNDTLSKALVVLQTTWFVFQCGSRWNAGLPLAELEVVTLGFAVLNAVIYAVWWNKPQGVEVAIAVPLKDPLEQCETPAESKGAEEEHAEFLSSDQSMANSRNNTQERKPNVLFRSVSTLLRPFRGMLSCRTIPAGAYRVPDFYADDKGPQESGKACTIAFIIGAIFGALHALAWTSAFPSHSDLVLWRLSTLIITAEPIFMLIVGFLYEEKPQQPSPESLSVKNVLQRLFIVLVALGIPLYIFARVTLIILAFVSLRALPPDAFKVVPWTSFIPHL